MKQKVGPAVSMRQCFLRALAFALTLTFPYSES
jgi:hypothetical protein